MCWVRSNLNALWQSHGTTGPGHDCTSAECTSTRPDAPHVLQGLEREHDEPLLLSLLRIHLAGGRASPRFSSGAVTRKNGAMPAKPGGELLLGSPASSG